MRHRITYIHADTAHAPIEAATSTSVKLSESTVFEREDKFTFDTARHPHISSLRIHVSTASTSKQSPSIQSPLAYNYQYGVHIYVLPNNVSTPEETAAFYNETNAVLEQMLGFTVDTSSWILSLNSFYFHAPSVPSPKVDVSLPDSWTDFDYFYQASRAVVKAYTPQSHDLVVNAADSDHYTEVGVFSVTKDSSPDDLILSGGLTVFNDGEEEVEDRKGLQKTLFHVKPRHRHVQPKTAVQYTPNGLHPLVSIPIPSSAPVDADISACNLYAYLTLEKSVFLDPYQLPESLTLLSNYGPKNLELPEYLLESWGNEVLLEVNQTAQSPIELTLHSRYQLPSENATSQSVSIASPMLFYACDVVDDVFLLKNSPFDNKHPIGGSYEKLFTEETVFYHVSEREQFDVDIPVASGNQNLVNLVTFASLLVGVWLVVSSIFTRVGKQKKE